MTSARPPPAAAQRCLPLPAMPATAMPIDAGLQALPVPDTAAIDLQGTDMRYLLFMLVSVVALLQWGGPADANPVLSARFTVPGATAPALARSGTSTHPIVGVWRLDKDPAHPDSLISYGVFNADGTYEEITTGAGTAVGAWQAMGEQTVLVTSVFQDLSEDPSVLEPGTRQIWMQAAVKSSGNVVTARFSSESRTLDGVVLEHIGPFPAQGARVTVDAHLPPELTEQGMLASRP